jgi:hypothetical protein
MPEWLAVRPDMSIPYRLPAEAVPTLRTENIVTPPDVSAFIDKLVGTIRTRFGDHAASSAAQEVEKMLGPYNIAAFMPQIVNGGLPIDVAITQAYRLPVPGTARGVPVLPATATIRIRIVGRLTDPVYQGVIPTAHFLGTRSGAEGTREQTRNRAARHAIDPVRFWQVYSLPRGTVNSAWLNFNWTAYRQMLSKAGVATTEEDSKGKTINTGPRGPAQFARTLHLSAAITVDSAPSVMLDAATLGYFQGSENVTVPEPPETAVTFVTEHSTWLLDQLFQPSLADLGRIPPLPAASAPVPRANPLGVPSWDPSLPRIQVTQLARESDFASLRGGLDVAAALAQSPDLLDDIQVAWPGSLAGLRAKVTRLLLPAATPSSAAGQGLFDSYLRSPLNNYLLKPPAGSGWMNPRSLSFRQAAVTTSNPFVKSRLPAMITGAVTTELKLPGRAQWPLADLEMMADVLQVHEGRTMHDVMTRDFQANAAAVQEGTDVVKGTYFGSWVEPALQPKDRPYDYNNGFGPLFGYDHITTNSNSAPSRRRYAQEVGTKKTWVGYTQLFLDVRYRAGVRAHASGLWGRFPREYFTDDEVLRAEIWVPTRHKEIWLNLGDVPPGPRHPDSPDAPGDGGEHPAPGDDGPSARRDSGSDEAAPPPAPTPPPHQPVQWRESPRPSASGGLPVAGAALPVPVVTRSGFYVPGGPAGG